MSRYWVTFIYFFVFFSSFQFNLFAGNLIQSKLCSNFLSLIWILNWNFSNCIRMEEQLIDEWVCVTHCHGCNFVSVKVSVIRSSGYNFKLFAFTLKRNYLFWILCFLVDLCGSLWMAFDKYSSDNIITEQILRIVRFALQLGLLWGSFGNFVIF